MITVIYKLYDKEIIFKRWKLFWCKNFQLDIETHTLVYPNSTYLKNIDNPKNLNQLHISVISASFLKTDSTSLWRTTLPIILSSQRSCMKTISRWAQQYSHKSLCSLKLHFTANSKLSLWRIWIGMKITLFILLKVQEFTTTQLTTITLQFPC